MKEERKEDRGGNEGGREGERIRKQVPCLQLWIIPLSTAQYTTFYLLISTCVLGSLLTIRANSEMLSGMY